MERDLKYDAFICHASADKKRVLPYVEALRAAGKTVWFDGVEVTGGTPIGAAIERAIKSSEVLVVFVSPDWLASSWARAEYTAFVNERRADLSRLVPVMLRPVEPGALPSFIGSVRYVDANSPTATFELVSAVSRGPHPPPPVPSQRWRGSFMAGGLAAGVAAIALTFAWWPSAQGGAASAASVMQVVAAPEQGVEAPSPNTEGGERITPTNPQTTDTKRDRAPSPAANAGGTQAAAATGSVDDGPNHGGTGEGGAVAQVPDASPPPPCPEDVGQCTDADEDGVVADGTRYAEHLKPPFMLDLCPRDRGGQQSCGCRTDTRRCDEWKYAGVSKTYQQWKVAQGGQR